MTEKEKLVNDSLGIKGKGNFTDDFIIGVTKPIKEKDDEDEPK